MNQIDENDQNAESSSSSSFKSDSEIKSDRVDSQFFESKDSTLGVKNQRKTNKTQKN